MIRAACKLIFVGSLSLFGQPPGSLLSQPTKSQAMAQPALPSFDWGACPFETCSYREWSVRETITVYDTWKPDRREIAKLSTGDKVTGVTGVVITYRPGTVRMDRDFPEQNLKRGEIILTYAYRGEGFSAVWFKKRFYDEFDISFAKWPDGTGCGGAHCAATYVDLGEKHWWAQVRMKSGAIGWVDMNHGVLGGFDF
jgi:hypothetical protein